MGDNLGYARVSTADQRLDLQRLDLQRLDLQRLDLQLDALHDAGCERVRSDTASGSLTRAMPPEKLDTPRSLPATSEMNLSQTALVIER
jgi:hypothetical protein